MSKLFTTLTLGIALLSSCSKSNEDLNDPRKYKWERITYVKDYSSQITMNNQNSDYQRNFIFLRKDTLTLTKAEMQVAQRSRNVDVRYEYHLLY